MDIKRTPKSKIRKKIRNAVMIVVGVAALAGITYGLTKLKPAAPTLDPSTAVIETVKRGEMVRDVRGNGTLVPEVVDDGMANVWCSPMDVRGLPAHEFEQC